MKSNTNPAEELVLLDCRRYAQGKPIYEIPHELSGGLRFYYLVGLDQNFCQQHLQMVLNYTGNLDVEKNMLVDALWRAIIITYGKPFKQQTGNWKLDPAEVFKEDVSLLENHQEMIVLRDKLVAHMDNSSYRITKAIFFDSGEKYVSYITTAYVAGPVYDRNILVKMITLIANYAKKKLREEQVLVGQSINKPKFVIKMGQRGPI